MTGEASAAGPASPQSEVDSARQGVPEPTSGVIVPPALTRRTRLSFVSTTTKPAPVALAARFPGPLSCARTAGPYSPHNEVVAAHAVPVPAALEIVPPASTRRMRFPAVSAIR